MTDDMYGKIKKLELLAEEITSLKKRGKKIVLCLGCFDLVHYGHIKHFEAARQQGDVLVVTVTEDKYIHKGPGRPFFTQEQRSEYLSALEMIDFVAINRWPTSIETIKILKPDVYVKGVEYQNEADDPTGNIQYEREAIEQVGGRIYFTNDIVYSSTALINNGLREEETCAL